VTFGLAAISAGQSGQGVRLLAASEALALQHGVKLTVEGEPIYLIYQQALGKARGQLSPEDFEAALQEGRALTMQQAVTLATEGERDVPPLLQAVSAPGLG